MWCGCCTPVPPAPKAVVLAQWVPAPAPESPSLPLHWSDHHLCAAQTPRRVDLEAEWGLFSPPPCRTVARAAAWPGQRCAYGSRTGTVRYPPPVQVVLQRVKNIFLASSEVKIGGAFFLSCGWGWGGWVGVGAIWRRGHDSAAVHCPVGLAGAPSDP